jgi:hypothetical protein
LAYRCLIPKISKGPSITLEDAIRVKEIFSHRASPGQRVVKVKAQGTKTD